MDHFDDTYVEDKTILTYANSWEACFSIAIESADTFFWKTDQNLNSSSSLEIKVHDMRSRSDMLKCFFEQQESQDIVFLRIKH